jgi:hypothetical protein
MMLLKRLTAETLGSLLLAATVIGSGIMAERLAGGNVAIALLANTGATVAVLATLIGLLGPVSGAHFNPAVSLVEALRGKLSWPDTVAYSVLQIVGCCAGALLAHAMFQLPILQASVHLRTGPAQWLAEGVATLGLVLVVVGPPAFGRRSLDGRIVDWGCLLVHGLNVLREPGDHNRALAFRYICRDPSARRTCVYRGTDRGGSGGARLGAILVRTGPRPVAPCRDVSLGRIDTPRGRSMTESVPVTIRNDGVEPTVIEYLKTPPNRATLVDLIARAGMR